MQNKIFDSRPPHDKRVAVGKKEIRGEIYAMKDSKVLKKERGNDIQGRVS